MTQTAFDPQMHGFAFENRWGFEEEEWQQLRKLFSDLLRWGAMFQEDAFGLTGAPFIPFGTRTLRGKMQSELPPVYGLCGGMCFTALDFYKAGLPLPRGQHRNDRPAPETVLRRYLWKRQLESLVIDGTRFLAWLIFLNHVPLAWPFRGGSAWLLARSKEEWKKLKASVEAGEPVPIVLVRDTDSVLDYHQVLAIGYDEADEVHSTIYLYDPNCPDKVSTIHIEFGEQVLHGQEGCDPSMVLRGFFCEVYTFSHPAEAIE
jgi:hypothetical protein